MSRLPRRWVTLDTEACRRPTPTGEVQRFRLGVAALDHQDRKGSKWRPAEWGAFTDPADLWRWITDRCPQGKTTVVLCHNLAYDLRIGRAFDVLPELGWRCDTIRLDGGATWAQWSGPGGALRMIDTVSWFGVGVDKLGALLGVPKLPLPADDASDAAWFDRCRVDVDILRAAWGQVLAWLEQADMGTWKPTGAGQGWAAFRHRFMDVPLLHHGNTSIAAAEREAAWTGRCEAWRHGVLPGAGWAEWDYRNAYAEICRDNDVPTRLRGHLGPKGCRVALAGDGEGSALIRARIDQQFPVAPTRGPHGILWPAGKATGWWWDIELRAVEALGGTVEPIEGWRYETGPALRTWATWVLDFLDQADDPELRMARLVVKGWSRTLVGKFGSRWSDWQELGDSPEPGVWLGSMVDADAGTSSRLLSLGGRVQVETDRRDAPDSVPQVMSWVMTATRLRLLEAMLAAGTEHVGYVDTDGLVVDRAGSEALGAAQLPGLRVKSRWRRVEVLGPRQLVLDGRLRAAGVPSGARRTGERSWSGEVWQSLAAAARRREVDSVTITDRTWTLRGVDHRRAHLDGGLTAPYRLPA